MGLGHHARITEDAEARILLEASESSYRKGGASASINGESISKEAVMNKFHGQGTPACANLFITASLLMDSPFMLALAPPFR